MIVSRINGVRMEAISACVPSNKINNREFARENFTDSLDATISALGIEERHVITKEDTTSLTLCVEAARRILEDIDSDEIGAVVMVTLTPDYMMPNNASYAQYLLGLPNGIAAFDINHACAGYEFGLWNAALICSNIGKKVLLLDGDVNTKYVSPHDKSTAILFGDAGTATLLSPDKDADDWYFTFNTDGSNRDAITVKMGFKQGMTSDMLEYKAYEDGSRRRDIDMYMDGERVFNYVVKSVPVIVNEFMDEIETSPDEYDDIIMHQANLFMIKRLAKKTGFDFKTKAPVCINKYGNTSSVSVPLTIASELKDKEVGQCLLVGMGAGLATGVGSVNLKGVKNYGVIMRDL